MTTEARKKWTRRASWEEESWHYHERSLWSMKMFLWEGGNFIYEGGDSCCMALKMMKGRMNYECAKGINVRWKGRETLSLVWSIDTANFSVTVWHKARYLQSEAYLQNVKPIAFTIWTAWIDFGINTNEINDLIFTDILTRLDAG